MTAKEVLFHLGYFPTVAQLAALYQKRLTIETHDHYVKQTYRNRMYIAGPNGKQLLSIPIVHPAKGVKPPTTAIQIDYKDNWQTNHWRSLTAAYSNSPFFEYYRDELEQIYQEKIVNLHNFNLRTYQILFDCLDIPFQPNFSETYQKETDALDLRPMVNARKESMQTPAYHQVFEEKYGFLHNLSAVDLLCNEGPNTTAYLKKIY
ncbi:MAG: WbqC family protein [Flavobacteriaceae bacterium]|nr:WbqC family protein [Flavobacteriaceae bacterium]